VYTATVYVKQLLLSAAIGKFFLIYYSMAHYMVILHDLLYLIFSFTVEFNNNKIIQEVIYTRNVNNNILTSKAYN
jgi:hypothetical protein